LFFSSAVNGRWSNYTLHDFFYLVGNEMWGGGQPLARGKMLNLLKDSRESCRNLFIHGYLGYREEYQ